MKWHSLHRAAELRQHAVAAGAEDPAFMPGYQSVDDVTVFAEGLERRFLVSAHEARIALDIGSEDRGQLPLDAICWHGAEAYI
jgi:hypothetical protein